MRRGWILATMRLAGILPAVAALVLAGAASAQQQGRPAFVVNDPVSDDDGHVYAITGLGTLGGDSSEASGINNPGDVVGWSATADGATHAFIHSAGVMTDLGTLPGGTFGFATGINDLGQVVGYGGINAYGPDFREFPQAFVWEGGSLRSLGALYCPCSFDTRYGTSVAYGINAAGQAVGDSESIRGEWVRHAFLWEDDAMEDQGDAGSLSISHAYSINDSGQVVGDLDGRAFLWEAGAGRDLGALPGHTTCAARAINAAGQVVGESAGDGGAAPRAILWEGGVMHDLGTLSGHLASRARAINESGQVVGESVGEAGSFSRAFLWKAGVMRDLNALIPAGSGWILTSAAGINAAGRIVGVGVHDGRRRAFLLTPTGASGG